MIARLARAGLLAAALAAGGTGCAGMGGKTGTGRLGNVEVEGSRGDFAFRSFYATGAPCARVSLEDGLAEGPAEALWADGRPRWRGTYRRGRLEGWSETFGANGALRFRCLMRDDTCQANHKMKYDSAGRPTSEWRPVPDSLRQGPHDSLTGAFLDRAGGAVVESTWYAGGKAEGYSFWISERGDTLSRTWYRAGAEDTSRTSWSPEDSVYRTWRTLSKVIEDNLPSLIQVQRRHLPGMRGELAFLSFVDADGTVSAALPLEVRGNRNFLRYAMAAIHRWRFPPIRGEVRQSFRQRIHFKP